jgi:hypothetical protein
MPRGLFLILMLTTSAVLMPALQLNWLTLSELNPLPGSALVWRIAAISAHMLVACAIARLIQRISPTGYAGQLALAFTLASPFTWSLITHEHPANGVGALVRYLLSMIVAIAIALIIDALLKYVRTISLRSLIAAATFSAVLTGLLSNFLWLNGMFTASSLFDTLNNLPGSGKQHALVINVPQLFGADDAIAFPMAPLVTTATREVTYAQMLDGRSAPGRIYGFPIRFGLMQRLNRAETLNAIFAHRHIVFGDARADARYEARHFGDMQPDIGQTQPSVRFSPANDPLTVVELIAATACKTPAPHVKLTFRTLRAKPLSAKFFRHAIRNGAKVGGNDDEPIAGTLSFNDLPPGRAITDIAYFPIDANPDAITFGVYDWQSGERWTAQQTDGAPVFDNAVTVPVSACNERA